MREVDPVTVRDSIVTSRGNFSRTCATEVLYSLDNQVLAHSFKSHPVRVVIQKDTTKILRRDSFVTEFEVRVLWLLALFFRSLRKSLFLIIMGS